MYREKRIALVIPAYNESKLIRPTLEGVPEFFDAVFVVDDKSPDDQAQVILDRARLDQRVHLLRHEVNQGPGGAIITGYLEASKKNFDFVVVVGGDNQMKLEEAPRLLDPLIDGRGDYAKGNRFLLTNLADTLAKMPRIRLVGNWIITGLTKVASGYYKTMDVVDGFTAISKRAIDTIDWQKAWRRYGYPMDFLIRLNAYGFKIVEVPRTAVYLPGERQSQIKGLSYALKVSPMLIKNFFWRLKFKYIFLDFHPLVFFYYLAFLLIPAGCLLGGYLLFDKVFLDGSGVTAPRAVLDALLLISGLQFLLFAMHFDMEEGR